MTRALIVDENSATRCLLQIKARQLPDMVLDEAATCGEAVGQLLHTVYDLVLLDLFFPVSKGIEMYQSLRTDPRHSKTKVVILLPTPLVDVPNLQHNDYILPRPVNPAEVQKTLVWLLNLAYLENAG